MWSSTAEQSREPVGLLAVGEQIGAGVQRAPGPVQRVGPAAAVAVQVLLDPTPAAVQSVTGEPHDVEGVQDRRPPGAARRWRS